MRSLKSGEVVRISQNSKKKWILLLVAIYANIPNFDIHEKVRLLMI